MEAVFSVRFVLRLYHIMWSNSNYESEMRIHVADALGQFGNPDEGECLLLEPATRRLLKTVTEDASVFVTVICKVYSRVLFLRA